MITRVGRRFVELGVLLFAGLGFMHVKLGKRTGFEHAQAILETKPAREAVSELGSAVTSFRLKILSLTLADDSGTRAKERRAQRRQSLSKKARARAPLPSEDRARAVGSATGEADASAPWTSPYGA